MAYPVKTAHYHGTRTRRTLTIVEAGDLFQNGKVYIVRNKTHARQIAAAAGAQCWNF